MIRPHPCDPTAAALIVCALAASCGSTGPRPVPPQGPTSRVVLDRLSSIDDVPGSPVLSLIATPDPEAVEGQEPDEGKLDQRQPKLSSGPPLDFDEVMRSVEQQFPLILAALEELDIARAEELGARGGFDLNVKGSYDSGVEGFYENDTTKLIIEQPTTAWGATIFGGYKRGAGDYPIWEGGLKTKEDGEFSLGVRLPLLQGRQIDSRRLALWRARLSVAGAEPIVRQKRLEGTRKAAFAYWSWVAAGQRLLIAERLRLLARNRQTAIEESFAAGDVAELAVVENGRFVVERELVVIGRQRDLEQAAIALSLFLRGPDGEPVIAGVERLPAALPRALDPALVLRDDDVALSLRSRPEVQGLSIELNQIDLELAKAENDLLPKLDVTVAGSQDTGEAVSDPDDKGPFELDALLTLEVPVQRRTARGKARGLEAKGRQVQQKLRFAQDSIVAEVGNARSAVLRTWERLGWARRNVEMLGDLEQRERVRLDEGLSDLFRVNLREQQTASGAATLVDLTAEHFRSLADYRASLGIPYDEVLR